MIKRKAVTDMYIPFGAIQNDNQAEDLLKQIHELEFERDRLIGVCTYEIEKYKCLVDDYQHKFHEQTKDAMLLLGEYTKNVANHHTKTLDSYALPSGKLVWKKREPRICVDKDTLLDWVFQYAPSYIKVVSVPKWDEIKQDAVWVNDHYEFANLDGELVPIAGVTLEPQEDVFEVK